MSGIEVAYELRNKTDYLLASSAELLVPGYAPVYPTAFQYLFDTSLGVPQALEKFAGSYFNYIDTGMIFVVCKGRECFLLFSYPKRSKSYSDKIF